MKVVFVHIGPNPTPTLFKAAEIAIKSLPEAQVCLISDQQELLKNFPGLTFDYDPKSVEPYVKVFTRKNKELRNIAGGYWLNTIVRLFAIIQVAKLYPDEKIIHLESDVYLYATSTELDACGFSKEFVSYPRLSPTRGIASFFHSPNLYTLETFLLNLKFILSEDVDIANDMDLLGRALNLEQARELTSVPGADLNGKNFIFDGAAIGQYLLGVDPVHTSGFVVSGFQNSDYPIGLSKLKWSIPNLGKIQFCFEGVVYELLSLHAHSKEILSYPDPRSIRWKQIIDEANLEAPREVIVRSFRDIHKEVPQFRDRIRIAFKNGFFRHIKRYISRRSKIAFKKKN